MHSIARSICAVLVGCFICGCQTHPEKVEAPEKPEPAPTEGHNLQTRNNALALLDDLLGDEKNLSKILIIKHNSDALGKLVGDISKAAGEAAKMLEANAKAEPGLNLKALDLPPGEAATRKAISKTKEGLLLHSKDAEFEFQLLLTQTEALNYASHLARVVAENESDPDRTREFLRLSAQLRELHERVLAQLHATK